MALEMRDTARQAHKLTESLIDSHKDRVKKFENFSLPELDIKNLRPMDILRDSRGEIDPLTATKTAIMMENFVRETVNPKNLDETSRASLPAWVKNGLALIASAQADDILDKCASVQVLPQRMGRIHYLDIVSERAKGQVADRAKLFDALNGFRGTQDFSSENIENEVIGAAGGDTFTATLGYGPVIPGTLRLTDGVLTVTDDRNGNLIGDVGAPGGGFTNTIDYLSKVVSVRLSAAAVASLRASYQYNIEAALQLPEFGIMLRAETVQARPRAVGASWSQQATMDFMNDYGIDAEPTIIQAGARIIAQEKFKHLVNTLRQNATGGAVLFDNTAPVGVSYRDHLKTFSLYLSRLQDLVWEATQVNRPNVLIISPSILFIVAFQDGFEGVKFANDGIAGPRAVGRLTQHDIDVFVDPTFVRDEGVLTHRGGEFISTACVIGDYVPLYRSVVHRRGFRSDIALLSEYVIKIINPNQIGTIRVTSL